MWLNITIRQRRRTRATLCLLARNAGVPEHVVRSVKQHLFVTKHWIETGPNQRFFGRFHPATAIADLWEAAVKGERIAEFRNFLGHVYLENTLMKHLKMPYKSPPPNAWVDPLEWMSRPAAEHFGAHDLCPNPVTGQMSEGHFERWSHLLGGDIR